MSNEFKRPRDSFTFSLGGLSTVASVAIAPAIADDRINRIRDERLKRGRAADSPVKLQFWRRWRRQPA